MKSMIAWAYLIYLLYATCHFGRLAKRARPNRQQITRRHATQFQIRVVEEDYPHVRFIEPLEESYTWRLPNCSLTVDKHGVVTMGEFLVHVCKPGDTLVITETGAEVETKQGSRKHLKYPEDL